MLKVAAFTGGRDVPSARFRVRQYIDCLTTQNVWLDEFAAPLGQYPPVLKAYRPAWVMGALLSRVPAIVRSYSYDLVLLQREMLSTLYTLEGLTKKPRVLDVDDAIWLHRRGAFAGKLARHCRAVICGNEFLASYFRRWNSTIFTIPTGVDTDRYVPGDNQSQPIIGWSGTRSGFRYLLRIEPALRDVLQAVPSARLRIVSDIMPQLQGVPAERVDFIPWSRETEIASLQDLAVGIMPLEDSDWERGKCSFKMLTYMACGVPVVVSPVGMNREVLAMGNFGVGATTREEWTEALIWLLRSDLERRAMGAQGRAVVLKQYSVRVVAPVLAGTLSSLV